jgi:hypothetical protein
MDNSSEPDVEQTEMPITKGRGAPVQGDVWEGRGRRCGAAPTPVRTLARIAGLLPRAGG